MGPLGPGEVSLFCQGEGDGLLTGAVWPASPLSRDVIEQRWEAVSIGDRVVVRILRLASERRAFGHGASQGVVCAAQAGLTHKVPQEGNPPRTATPAAPGEPARRKY